ncbi:hypothetical protein BRD07_03055 [Halobacteriales archaeon QS_9_68_42]|nr:MAG: hypothetical protein BRD07_03055 [Halobacteriales archaeon QS_9_68_42]
MNDRRGTVEPLAGAPSTWPTTLRDLLRAAADNSDRASLAERLGDAPSDAAERRLEFLESVDILDGADPTPGRYGREYLDTHDEGVLYEALAAGVAGFEEILEGLAVRPLTDVEVADLLSTALNGDADPALARDYRAWLEALGYLEHDDGVNELTRQGRRLVATTDELTPPGSATETPSIADPADAAPSNQSPATGSDAADGENEDTLKGPTDQEALERELRAQYDDTCMVCGDRRRRGPEAGHSAVHYPMPTAAPHDGPVAAENALVLCPNHRADFEHGTVTVDPRTLTVDHAYESAVSGRTLSTADDHEVGAQYLAYHNNVVAD